MLYRNSIFLWQGQRYRLLHVQQSDDKACAISLDKKSARTRVFRWSEISGLDNLEFNEEASPEVLNPTPAAIEVRDEALRLLGDLATQTTTVFYGNKRGQLIAAQAQKMGCSKSVLYKHFIHFLQGGRTPSALLGRFNKCGKGKSLPKAVSGPAKSGGEPKYLLTEKDLELFKKVITSVYLKDERISIAASYKRLIGGHYRAVDGNGDKYLPPIGEYPSLRQFEYYLRKNYPTSVRKRARLGDKSFELNERGILGTVMADCEGVGHYFEADASIADVYLRATDDISKIIGKPTIYLITDRKSRLIVGWYVGLENASWACAMQALVSISQDKAAICKRLGITYDPNDWPAQGVYPQSVLVDKGEWTAKESTQLTSEMDTDVVYVPSKRGDWKPIAESGFKCLRVAMQDGIPGMDPPENAKKRQGIKYEKDACLTLNDFERIFVEYIIRHNRTPNTRYRLSLKELGDGVSPDPISLWNHGIVDRTGVLSLYDEAFVKRTLLPQSIAKITTFGISIHGCFYSCKEAVQDHWFELARSRNMEARVSFDRRLVDVLYVQDPFKQGRVYECRLTTTSEDYSGKSVAEVHAIEMFRKAKNAEMEHRRLGTALNYNDRVDAVVIPAKKKLKDAKLKNSRKAAKVDIKTDRAHELRSERQALLSPDVPASSARAKANVLPLARPKPDQESQWQSLSASNTSADIADPFNRLNERLIYGNL
jgi:putative transposase